MKRNFRLALHDGFTLLEIVVALAILSLSVTVTMQLISGAFSNIARVNQYFIASNHAENIMNELLVSPNIKGPMESRGDFDDGYQWSAVAAERVLPPDPNIRQQGYVLPLMLLEMQVDVRWQQRNRPHVYTLRSVRVINTLDSSLPGLTAPQLSASDQPRQPGNFLSQPASQERLGPRRQRPGREDRQGGGRGLFPQRPPDS